MPNNLLEAAAEQARVGAAGTDDMEWFSAAGGRGVSNQLPYNLLWRSIESGILPACRARQHGVLCYSPLQQGLLSGKYTSPDQLQPGRLRTRMFAPDRSPLSRHGSPGLEPALFGPDGAIEKLRAAAEGAGVSMAELATGWLLAQPGVDVVIVGASTAEQARRNAVIPAAARSDEAVAAATQAVSDILFPSSSSSATVRPQSGADLRGAPQTDGLFEEAARQGGWVDQYAAASRIHGNDHGDARL